MYQTVKLFGKSMVPRKLIPTEVPLRNCLSKLHFVSMVTNCISSTLKYFGILNGIVTQNMSKLMVPFTSNFKEELNSSLTVI